MNNGQQSSDSRPPLTEPRPALEAEDIKSQLNAIVAPYGILFPETLEEESSMSIDLTNPFSLNTELQQFTDGHSLTLHSATPTSFSAGETTLKTVCRQPTSSAIVDGKSLGNQSAQGSVVESTAEKTAFAEGRWPSLDGSPSPESQGGPQSKAGVTKSGSKLVKGWKKFRQSLKAGTALSSSPGTPQPLFGSHSSVAEDATRNGFPAVSSVGEQRKALSDLDRPFEMGRSDDTNILDFGPGFGMGLTHKFSSGSLKGLLLKGTSISSVKDMDVDLLPPIRSRATLMESHDNNNTLDRTGGGAVVVETELVMSLGKMRQYGKDDWIAQQQQQRLVQHSQLSSSYVHPGPVSSTDVIPSTTREDAAAGGTNAVVEDSIAINADTDAGAGLKVAHGGVEEDLLASSGTTSEEEEAKIPAVAVIEPDIVIVTEPEDASQIGDISGIDIEGAPTIVPREHRLGQDLATPQRWRLSTRGTPEVVGSICERRVSGVYENEIYLQRLMQDSVTAEQDPSETNCQPDDNGEDRVDNAFKVPLYQSVQLASAMFDNGQRIPLVLYYVTEELRARVARGDVVETIDSLFPIDWEESDDEEFEKLVEVFDQRPFGQFFDLSDSLAVESNNAPPLPTGIDHVHPLDVPAPAPETDTTAETDNPEHTESNGDADDDTPTPTADPTKARVTSRDLSRLILRFLKDLPEPLIPADVFSTFSAMTKLQTLDSVKIQASSLLVQLLSTEHRELLQFLLEFLDEVVLKSLRDELERLEQLDPLQQTAEHEANLLELGGKCKQTLDRLSKILGAVFSHATTTTDFGTGSADKQSSQTTLYRHYKRDFELKALQEQNEQAIRNSAAVFQSLLTFRITIFGASSFSLSQENNNGGEYGFAGSSQAAADQDEDASVDGSVSDMDSDYEYQSDSALYEITSKRPLGRRRHVGTKTLNSPKRPLTKSRTLHSRHHHNRQMRRGRKQRKSDFSLVVTTAEGDGSGADGQGGVQKKTSAETLCDSAVDMITNVDVLALAAMQEHMARSMRNQKHLPHPSVATLHSILAEAHSVIGAESTSHYPTTAASVSAAAADGTGAGATEDVITDDAASMTRDAARTEYGEAATADRSDLRRPRLSGKGIEGEADDGKRERGTYDRDVGISHAGKPKREYGFMDFLQEPLDRKQEEREIQLVEKEILRSEITTKFLAANLAGLYPSSSQTAIPSVILPSARSTLLQPQTSSRSSTDAPTVPQTSNELLVSTTPTSPIATLSRELTLAPREQIQLPQDHRASDDCSCSYCTTLVQPSQIPVLTRDEYEKAELQSQCDSKDQHIAELLKTVQSLQGEVNILNAKLLFLHDHHTTRPMRRRTLARNSFPAVPSTGGGDWTSRQHPPQQLSDHPTSAPQMGQTPSSHSPPASTTAGGAGGNAHTPLHGSPKLFAEGIQMSNNTDTYVSRGKSRHMSLGWDFGHSRNSHGHDMSTLEEDEAMSILDLDDPHRPSPPPLFPANNSTQRLGHPGFGPREFGHQGNALLREVVEEEDDEEEHDEPEREGEDLLDEFYYMDAYKTMDQQLYRRPILPIAAPPRPMSTDQYKMHHRMSLPIQNLSKRLSLGQTFRWKGRATAA